MILPHFVQSPLLRSVAGFYHAFAGVDPQPGRKEAERLRTVFSVPPTRIGTLRQVHSATVLEWEETDAIRGRGGPREGDALWTANPGTGVGVRTADCVPILIADPGAPACAAVHVGWRGFAAGIIEAAVSRFSLRLGPGSTGRLLAAAGPSARGCCYEIGEEVADFLRPRPGGARFLFRGETAGKWMADLPSFALEALAAAGVPRANLDAASPCTVCSISFHSFRREKSLTGRQLSFIYMMDHSPHEIFPKRQETG